MQHNTACLRAIWQAVSCEGKPEGSPVGLHSAELHFSSEDPESKWMNVLPRHPLRHLDLLLHEPQDPSSLTTDLMPLGPTLESLTIEDLDCTCSYPAPTVVTKIWLAVCRPGLGRTQDWMLTITRTLTSLKRLKLSGHFFRKSPAFLTALPPTLEHHLELGGFMVFPKRLPGGLSLDDLNVALGTGGLPGVEKAGAEAAHGLRWQVDLSRAAAGDVRAEEHVLVARHPAGTI